MDAEASAAVGFVVAGAATLLTTPAAIATARRLQFYDRPHGYHKHQVPTPLLGGTAVLTGFLVGAVAVGVSGKLLVLVACAVGMWLVGTLDDWIPVAPVWRVLSETGAALALVSVGLGWKTSAGGAADVALTVVWVVGLVNGFNLMDNLDGACGTVAGVSSAGVGTLAAIEGDRLLAALAFALAGACLAFLRWNLARPAKIFLGDGGSRPIGLLVAGLAMATCRQLGMGDAERPCRGAARRPRDPRHLARHGLAPAPWGDTRYRRPRPPHPSACCSRVARRVAVAIVLAIMQAILCACAIVGDRLGTDVLVTLALAAVTIGVVAIAVLDTAHWRPPGNRRRHGVPWRSRAWRRPWRSGRGRGCPPVARLSRYSAGPRSADRDRQLR